MFGGEITDGMVYGSISRGGGIYVYGQSRGKSPVFHMYGGKIKNGETQGTMRGMAIGVYGETKAETCEVAARIFGGIINFTGPGNSKLRRYTLYTNRSDMECLRIYDDSGMQALHSTATVGACADSSHGVQVMARSYASALPADILVSSTEDHGMMVIEAPYVQTAADGSIDTAASYVMIQDQRGGIGADFYEVDHSDYTVHHSGRIRQKFTFEELIENNYIPVTAPEFVGQKAYEAPEVTVQGGTPVKAEDLLKLTVSSNYPLAVININAVDSTGAVTNLDKVLFNGLSEKGVPRSYALEASDGLKALDAAAYSRITVEVVTSTGKRFTPIDLKLH